MKKFLSLFLASVLATALAACGSAPQTVEETPVEETAQELTEQGEVISPEEDPVELPDEIEEPVAQETGSPLDMIVSKSQAQSTGGFYILVNDDYVDIGKQEREALVRHCPTYGSWYKRIYDSVIELGNIQIPSCDTNGKIIAFSTAGIPTLKLYEVENSYYTIGIFKTTDLSASEFADIDDMSLPDDWSAFINFNSTDNISVYPIDMLINGESLNDKLVEGFVPLNQGESATLSWYTGTMYHEKTKTANYRYYTLNPTPINVEGSLGKNGYAEYDILNVPNGLYWIGGYGLIDIQQ